MQINVLVAVPPIVVFLAKSPLATQYDLSSVLVVLCGAAPLSVETINDAMKRSVFSKASTVKITKILLLL